MPVGTPLEVGDFDGPEVLATTEERLREIISGERPDVILVFSCVGRYFILGFSPLEEAGLIGRLLGSESIPYMLTYSSGELCPVHGMDKEHMPNRSHNDTCVFCLL